jgi:hypothetical protein
MEQTKPTRTTKMKRMTRMRMRMVTMEKKRMLRARQIRLRPITLLQQSLAQLLSSSSWISYLPFAPRYPTRHTPSYSCSSLRSHRQFSRSHHRHPSNYKHSSHTSGPRPMLGYYPPTLSQTDCRHTQPSSSISSIIPVSS